MKLVATRGVLVVALLALAACEPGNGPLSQNGNLGNGGFTYECQTPADHTCDCSNNNLCLGGNPPFPSAVALGSEFGVRFTPNDGTTNVGNPVLKAVSPDYLQITGTTIVAVKPGLAGLYAASSIDGSFVDFTVVDVVTPISLQIVDSGGSPVDLTTTVPVGSEANFTVQPLGSSGMQIAGTLNATWATSDPTVAKLTLGSPNNTMQIAGISAGMATITVASTGSVQTTFTVQVQ